MIELFTSFETLNTPRGIAICGAYPEADGTRPLSAVLPEMAQKLENLHSISYQTTTGNYQNLSVEDVQYTTSIGNGINLYLLLGHINLPSDLTPDKTIYRSQLQSSTSTISQPSCSSIQ